MQEIKIQKIDSAQTVAAWDIQQRAFRPLLEKYQDCLLYTSRCV